MRGDDVSTVGGRLEDRASRIASGQVVIDRPGGGGAVSVPACHLPGEVAGSSTIGAAQSRVERRRREENPRQASISRGMGSTLNSPATRDDAITFSRRAGGCRWLRVPAGTAARPRSGGDHRRSARARGDGMRDPRRQRRVVDGQRVGRHDCLPGREVDRDSSKGEPRRGERHPDRREGGLVAGISDSRWSCLGVVVVGKHARRERRFASSASITPMGGSRPASSR